MQIGMIGMIGLGHMGSKMVRRLMQAGHACVVHDPHTATVDTLHNQGAVGATARDNAGYANRVLSAMRKQFGGHDEKKAER